MAALPTGGHVLYNFLTGKCVRMNFLTKDYYDNFAAYGEDNPQVRHLVELGFLVDFDELAYLRNRARLDCGNTSELKLTICPTLACNFACPYCFERHRTGAMSQSVQDDVLAFAQAAVNKCHPARMQVTWYGGEPLLQPQIIRSLSERLMRLCEERKIAYDASIITNGYFLSPKTYELLRDCKVDSIQITLDGPNASTHNKTRHLVGGGGTFEKILQSIAAAPRELELTVRCNVHKRNMDEYAQLEERIDALARKSGANIGVYAGRMETSGDYAELSVPMDEFARFRKKTAHEVTRVAYVGPVCMVPKLADVVIDERGNLYKCLESVGREEEAFGNVCDYDLAAPAQQGAATDVLSRCYDQAWPKDDECMDCPVLPACMGGCPQRRWEGRKECSEIRYLLDEYVIELAEELARHGKD